MIEVRNLSKYFGNRCAVNGISFTVEQSTIVGFLGPNGAGKTTTLRILTGYMPPTAGTARVAGHDVVQESLAVRSVVGYLPEAVPLYPEMRVREYLNFRGKLRGMDRPQRNAAIARVVERCWLADAIERLAGDAALRARFGKASRALVEVPDLPTGSYELRAVAEDFAHNVSSETLTLTVVGN